MQVLARGPERTELALAGLSAIDRAQLEATSERYGGQKLTAEALYAAEAANEEVEGVLPSRMCHVRILRDGTPAYDAWLYPPDSGTVFVVRTTTAVADIVQTGVECGDRQLAIALREVLASAPTVAKKASSKKVAAKKASAKKAPANKKGGGGA